MQGIFSRVITRGRQQLNILQSLPILSKVLMLILGTIMIPFILALTFSTLLILVFAIPAIILLMRWFAVLLNDYSEIGIGDMKISTFYAESKPQSARDAIPFIFCMSVVGGVFGGIHCAGWFFDFPSSAEAMLWRFSSAVLTGIAFLIPIIVVFLGVLFIVQEYFAVAVSAIIILVYVVSRLLLIVEAFISLRHLTPGMLALVKWTSFLPHI